MPRAQRPLRLVASTITVACAVAGLGWFSHARGGLSRDTQAAPAERRAVLFYAAEVHGAVEPCGCTSDPLGDISRLAVLVGDARREASRGAGGRQRQAEEVSDFGGGVALLDAGGLLYPDGAISAKEAPSADLRARFLASQFERLGLLGAALGETDARAGAVHVRPPHLASNLTGASALIRPPRVTKVGGISFGVLGVADPAVAVPAGARFEDPLLAAKRDVAALRQAGAEVVVLLAAVEKATARKLAREAGADVVVVGKRVGAGMPRLERVGGTFIVAPSDELQRVGRLEIVLRGAPVGAGAPLNLQDAAAAKRSDCGGRRSIGASTGCGSIWRNGPEALAPNEPGVRLPPTTPPTARSWRRKGVNRPSWRRSVPVWKSRGRHPPPEVIW